MIAQIYEVRSPAEAAALAVIGVDHIGVLVGWGAFPREVAPQAAREIFSACQPGAIKVALSLSPDVNEIERVLVETRPDIIHIGAAPELIGPETVARLRPRLSSVRVMRSIPVVDAGSLEIARAYDGIADFLLLDSHQPGDKQIGALGRTHDWAISRRIVEAVATPCILAGGLGPDNVAAAIAAVGPAGVDSKTRTDRDDGTGKDLDRVRHFVSAARTAVASEGPEAYRGLQRRR